MTPPPIPLLLTALLAATTLAWPGAHGARAAQDSPEAAPDLEDVRTALDRGELEQAHARLSRLLANRSLELARERTAADDLEAALRHLDRAIGFEPRHPQANEARLALRPRVAALWIDRAATEMEAGRTEDALILLDRAVEIDAKNPRGELLRGRAFFTLAEKTQSATYLEDALESFLQATRRDARDPAAWFGASRAGRMLGRSEEALAWARRGLELAGGAVDQADLRTAAQTAFDGYLAALRDGAGEEVTRELFLETESLLERTLVAAPSDDPWGWLQLSYLHEWAGSLHDARLRVETGLDLAPDDRELSERFVDLVRREGGRAAVIAAFDERLARFPESAPTHLARARERFELALETVGESGTNDVDGFLEAERGFARARELDPALRETALGWEAVARSGAGWCRFHQGDLDGAKQAFLSMEDLFPGALEFRYASLPQGTRSLELVAGRYYAAQQDESLARSARAKSMEKAAKIYDYLHEYRPQLVDWANNAGFMNRDVAEMYEMSARERARASRAEGAFDAEGEWSRAEEELALAIELMEKSWRAYRDAAALAPDDVRIQNDTGLIPTYYLQRDLDEAERYLTRAVELGEGRLAAVRAGQEELDADARYELENALGDAYQNLGVLHLRLRNDPRTAQGWFEKCAAIGPDPRVLVTDTFLPGCAAAIAGGENPFHVTAERRWDAPLATRTSPADPN